MLRPASDVVARQLGDSAVLIHLTTNRIYELNPTGARIWELVGTGTTIDAVLNTLRAEFDAPAETVQNEVNDLVRNLMAEGLLVDA
jgi:hypothetical protein